MYSLADVMMHVHPKDVRVSRRCRKVALRCYPQDYHVHKAVGLRVVSVAQGVLLVRAVNTQKYSTIKASFHLTHLNQAK
jgi:hypothetical protein